MRRITRQADVARRDISHRAHGLLAELRAMLRHEQVSNDVLKARVATRVGRAVSHPGAIRIVARDGKVELSGRIMAKETDGLIRQTRAVRGVREVINRLEPTKDTTGVRALQGAGRESSGSTWNIRQEHWSPGTRAAGAAAGFSLLAMSLGARRQPMKALTALGGAALLARAFTDLSLSRLTGINAGHRAIDIDKAVHIDVPVDRVFDFWSDFTNFPYFMSHVRDVRDLGDGRSRWVVEGPAGIPLEWTARVTRMVQHELIAWESEPSAIIQSRGQVSFWAERDNSTTLRVRMSYNPPAGALGHAIAKALGADPKSRMDGDLTRLKTFFERGTPARDAAKKIFSNSDVVH